MVFADAREAIDHVTRADELRGEVWEPLTVGLGNLPVLCAALGIGYLVLPQGRLSDSTVVGPVFDVVDTLEAKTVDL